MLVLAISALLVSSAMSLTAPQIIRWLVDGSLASGHEGVGTDIDHAAVLLGLVFFIQGIGMALRWYFFDVAGERIVIDLRRNLFDHIMCQEISYFDATSTGELINRLASDTTALQSTLTTNISIGIRSLVQVIGGVSLLLYTSPRLTLIMAFLIPTVALGAVFIGRKIRVISRSIQDAQALASGIAQESISNVKIIKFMGEEASESRRYGSAIEKSFTLAKKKSGFAATFYGTTSFAAHGTIAVMLWYGGHLVAKGGMTIGELAAFLLYSLVVAFSLAGLGGLWSDFMRAMGAAERIHELLQREPRMRTDGTDRPHPFVGRIVFDDVSFSYPTRPDVPVLANVNLELAPGKVVALVGHSGSGKSTIAALVGRLYDPTGGRILLDELDLRELDLDWLRHNIAVVPQEPSLFSSTIESNIRYGSDHASRAAMEEAAKLAYAHDFVTDWPDGYETLVGERGVQLSGGQRQRVAIARAILRDPRILILDEATSALDAQSEALVKKALDHLMEGRTTLVIAHRLSTVRDADEVLVVSEGRIVQSGRHDDLMATAGIYRALVEQQLTAA